MTPSQELPGDPTTMVFAVPLAGTTVRRAIRRSTPMVPVRQRSHSLENSPRWIRWSPRTSESEVPNVFFFGKRNLKQTTKLSSWWLNEPSWKIWVKMGIFPNFRGENKKSLKPPSSFPLLSELFLESGKKDYCKDHDLAERRWSDETKA